MPCARNSLASHSSHVCRWLPAICLVVGLAMLPGAAAWGEDETPDEAGALPGHSYHGEVFNEGPRQKAYLMEGMPAISFDITTNNDEARKFFNQGVGQLHGFWYFEAERSFRQVALLDPDCAMAYWGMAQANIDNTKRSTDFIEQALKRKDSASEREKMYIDALSAFIKAGSKKNKERHEAYTKALEKILYKYPQDIECRALLALHIWKARDASSPVQSYIAVDAIYDQVFAVQSMHPAHHYRIHLWDAEHAENALESASKCGQSAPGIAHMWHMSGHIYSRLKRYDDAAWQQEASARVDHAHMMRDRVMPDQIHNFAHNNEWLIRDLNYVGRAHDAVDLAKNMCELPRHPKYNTLEKRGSAYYGRLRLAETLIRFRMWEELLALANTAYLDATDSDAEQVKRLRWIGQANYRLGQTADGDATLAMLEGRLETKRAEQTAAMDEAEAKLTKPAEKPEQKGDEPAKSDEAKPQDEEPKECDDPAEETSQQKPAEEKPEDKKAAEKKPAEEKPEDKKPVKPDPKVTKAREEARKKFDAPIKELEKGVHELQGWQAVAGGDFKKGLELLKKAGGVDAGFLAWLQYQSGDKEPALSAMRKYADGKKQEVVPQVDCIELLWQAEKRDEAEKVFAELRKLAGHADLDVRSLARLASIAEDLGLPADWREPQPSATDVGVRPSLDSLGPFRWQPSPAPDWTLKDVDGKEHSLRDFRGKPVILIFFLGNGCLHCAEQLQAFAKAKADFDAVDLPLFAISSDDQKGLKISIDNYEDGMPIPLVADPEQLTFREYRAYDDFEKQPLHGTYIIDSNGLIRWQDISYEPFMDTKFVKEEALRLLKQ